MTEEDRIREHTGSYEDYLNDSLKDRAFCLECVKAEVENLDICLKNGETDTIRFNESWDHFLLAIEQVYKCHKPNYLK